MPKRQSGSAAAAVRTFTRALKVEAVHVVLYQDALDHMEDWRGEQHSSFVCPECGNTPGELSSPRCFMCERPRSKISLGRPSEPWRIAKLGESNCPPPGGLVRPRLR